MVRLLGIIFVGLGLVGCGASTAPKASAPTPQVPVFEVPKPVDRVPFLKAFPLLNSDLEEGPAAHGDFTGAPLGVLIGMPDSGEGSFCSASHLGDGVVATNAHCVQQRAALGPEKYFVVFYDRAGKKRFTALEAFLYVGDMGSDDVALLKIPAAQAAQWDAVPGKAFAVPLAEPTNENPEPTPVSFDVRIWAFDPFSPSHPKLLEAYEGMPGMVFQPRSCRMTRTLPSLVGVKVPTSGPVQRTNLHSRGSNPAMHFFIDSCDRFPVHGNSGSLVTVAGAFESRVGVYHWGVGAGEKKDKYDYFEYQGTDGATQYLHQHPEGMDFFGVGYLFQHLSAPFNTI